MAIDQAREDLSLRKWGDTFSLVDELVRRSLSHCGRGKSGLQRVRAPGNAWGA